MGLFCYIQKDSIISEKNLPTTEIIEPIIEDQYGTLALGQLKVMNKKRRRVDLFKKSTLLCLVDIV